MPRVEPFELPFVHKDAMSSTLALQDYQDMHLAADYKGYHPLLTHVHAGFLLQTKQPVTTMADLKGMKIRAAARSGVWLLEAMGATACRCRRFRRRCRRASSTALPCPTRSRRR